VRKFHRPDPRRPDDPRYAAVPDPADPTRITFWWSRSDDGWKSLPGHGLQTKNIPDFLSESGQAAWALRWHAAVANELGADPIAAQARYAALTGRCCHCDQPLADDESLRHGLSPECRLSLSRARMSAALLKLYAQWIRHFTATRQLTGGLR
jgi:hypothetical protein